MSTDFGNKTRRSLSYKQKNSFSVWGIAVQEHKTRYGLCAPENKGKKGFIEVPLHRLQLCCGKERLVHSLFWQGGGVEIPEVSCNQWWPGIATTILQNTRHSVNIREFCIQLPELSIISRIYGRVQSSGSEAMPVWSWLSCLAWSKILFPLTQTTPFCLGCFICQVAPGLMSRQKFLGVLYWENFQGI